LREAGVEAVVDVRRFPMSKFEHFNRENLESILKKNGIDYYYLGEKPLKAVVPHKKVRLTTIISVRSWEVLGRVVSTAQNDRI